MLHHGRQRNRKDGNDRGHDEAPVGVGEDGHGGVLPLHGKAYPGGFLHGAEVAQAEACRHDVAAQHAQQDGDDLDHPFAPDVADDYDEDGKQRNPPVLPAVVDGRAGQDEADCNDDGTGNHRREEAHHLCRSESGEQSGQDEIDQAGAKDAYTGIRESLRLAEAFCNSHLHHCCIAPQKSK